MAAVCEMVGQYEKEIDIVDGTVTIVARYNIKLATGVDTAAVRVDAENAFTAVLPVVIDGIYHLSSYRIYETGVRATQLIKGEARWSTVKPKFLIGASITFRGASRPITTLYAPYVQHIGSVNPQIFAGALNLDESGIPQGIEIAEGLTEMNLAITMQRGIITMANVNTWLAVQNHVNSATWGVFPTGCIQFKTFSLVEASGQKSVAEFQFIGAPPEMVSFGGQSMVKEGHDFLQVITRKVYHKTDNVVGAKTIGLSVHRPWPRVNFVGAFKVGAGGSLTDLITAAMVTNFSS